MSRVDLHLHSRYSDRPSEWVLRQLGMPQSYSSPEKLYRQLDAAGMTLKTITDHNRIEGVLEIAHHPDVFLSEEVTTYFADGCKVHLLVWNIEEAQHREIQRLRPDIIELTSYLRGAGIPHGVAHPLSNLNGLLTADHFEKMILLFRIFEGRNGNREPLAQQISNLCLESLTPEKISELANRHNLAPAWPHAERKVLTGGSDDHGGLYPGRTWTGCPGTGTAVDFFQRLAAGTGRPEGAQGDPLRLSSSLYTTAFTYARDKLKGTAPRAADLMGKIAERFIAGHNPTAFSFSEKIGHVTEALRTGQAFEFLKPGETSLTREFAEYAGSRKLKHALDQIIAEESNTERRSFRMASHITNEFGYHLALQFIRRVERGNVLDALQSATGLLPVAGAVLPYIVAFHQHAPDRPLLEKISTRLLPSQPQALQNRKRAWFTDTLEDVNGVARTIRAMTLAASDAGADLTVVTSRSTLAITDIPIKNFPPVGEFELPEYKLQKLSFPPLLDIIDYVQKEGFTELIVSTPGPVGICALVAGKLLGLKMSSIYHTDFPQYARFLSDDTFMESLVWKYMDWFYAQFQLVYVNSEFYRQCWVDRGVRPDKIAIFPRGMDTELFHPKHHHPGYWHRKGATGPVLLYVGRISKEKELAFLVDVEKSLRARNVSFTLALVGEGPYREELATLLPQAIFTGILTGQELGNAYASADLFVFPSTTDTFGNVVLEAMASGLPVAVSDVGGPRELVREPRDGRVLPARDLTAWTEGLASMISSLPGRDQRLALAASVRDERSWDRAFKTFWDRSS